MCVGAFVLFSCACLMAIYVWSVFVLCVLEMECKAFRVFVGVCL